MGIINLPSLSQKITVDTREMRAAQLDAIKFGSEFEATSKKVGGANRELGGEIDGATGKYSKQAEQLLKNTEGNTKFKSSLNDVSAMFRTGTQDAEKYTAKIQSLDDVYKKGVRGTPDVTFRDMQEKRVRMVAETLAKNEAAEAAAEAKAEARSIANAARSARRKAEAFAASGKKAAEEFNGAFDKNLLQGIDKTASFLPDLTKDQGNLSEAMRHLATYRSALEELRTQRVNLEISDEEAKRKLIAINTGLQIIKRDARDIDVKMDTTAAQAELDRLLIKLGMVDEAAKSGGGRSMMPGIPLMVGAVAPLAAPIAAAAVGGSLALASPLAAAAGGVGALGLGLKANYSAFATTQKNLPTQQAAAASAQTTYDANQNSLTSATASQARAQQGVTNAQQRLATASTPAQSAAAIIGLSNANATLAASTRSVSVAQEKAVTDHIKLIEAQTKLKETQDKLSGPMAGMVAAIDNVKSSWKGFQEATAKPSFGLMATGMNIVSDLLPKLTPLFNVMADAAQKLLDGIGAGIKGPGFVTFLKFLETTGPKAFTDITKMVMNLGIGLTNLLMGFAPLGSSFMDTLVGWTEKFKDFSKTSGDPNSGLSKFMGYVKEEGPKVWKVIQDLLVIVGKLVVGLAPVGSMQLSGLVKMTDALAAMSPEQLASIALSIVGIMGAFKGVNIGVGTVKGIKDFTSSLSDAKFILGGFKVSTFRGIGDGASFIGRSLKTAGSVTKEAAGYIRDDLVSLGSGAKRAATAVGSAVKDMGRGLLEVGKSGASAAKTGLVAFAEGAGKAGKAALEATKAGGRWIFSLAATTFALASTAAAALWAETKTLASAAASAIASAATKIWTGIQAAWTVVMNMNPISLIIIGIGLLVAAVVYAYFHFETFRKIVDIAWQGIKDAAAFVVKWFMDTALPNLRNAATWIGEKFSELWGTINNVWTWIKDHISTVWGVISGVFENIKKGVGVVGTAFEDAKLAVGRAFSGLLDAVKGPVNTVLSWIKEHFVDPLNTMLSKIGAGGIQIPWPSMDTGGAVSFAGNYPGKRASGGSIPGHSPHSRSDNILTWMTAKEFVLPVDSTSSLRRKIGDRGLEDLRQGNLPAIRGYADGGGIWDSVKNVAGNVGNMVSTTVSNVTDFIKDPLGAVQRFVANLGNSIGSNMWSQTALKTMQNVGDGLGQKVKDFFTSASAGSGNVGGVGFSPGAGVLQWANLVVQALAMVGQPIDSNLIAATLRRMNQESGGNPNAINLTDSNALKGTPSKGLMQVIDPTFQSNRDPSLPNNVWDPLANIVASMRYAIGQYGTIASAYNRAGGYAEGGLVGAENGMSNWGGGHLRVGERGPELVSLPYGSKVFNTNTSRSMVNRGFLNGPGGRSPDVASSAQGDQGGTVQIYVTVNAPQNMGPEEVGTMVARKIGYAYSSNAKPFITPVGSR